MEIQTVGNLEQNPVGNRPVAPTVSPAAGRNDPRQGAVRQHGIVYILQPLGKKPFGGEVGQHLFTGRLRIVTPAQLFPGGTVGGHIEQVAPCGHLSDAEQVVQEGIRGNKAASGVHCLMHKQTGGGFQCRIFDAGDFHVPETVVHKFRRPCELPVGADEPVGLEGGGGIMVSHVVEFRFSVFLQLFRIPDHDFISGSLIHRQPHKPGHILPEIEDIPVFPHMGHSQGRVYPVQTDGFAGTGTESTGRRGGIGHGVLPCTVVKGGQDPVFVVQPGVKMLPAPELVVDNGGLVGAFPAGIGGQHGFSVDFQRQNEFRIVPPGRNIVIPGGLQVFVVPAVAALHRKEVFPAEQHVGDIVAGVPQGFAVIADGGDKQILRHRTAVQPVVCIPQTTDMYCRMFHRFGNDKLAAEHGGKSRLQRIENTACLDEVDTVE